jgi:hypothetical protein
MEIVCLFETLRQKGGWFRQTVVYDPPVSFS